MNNKEIEYEDNNQEDYYQKYNGLWGESLSQLKNRLVFSRRSRDMVCIYCGGDAQTREHCPPRSFFPEHDFPNNLRVLPACEECNKGFSRDEEIVRDYLDCLFDCNCNNKDYSSDIKSFVEWTEKNKWPIPIAERIFSKVAQGLAIYDRSECFGDSGWLPRVTDFVCKHWISLEEWNALDAPIAIDVFPELGSRESDGAYLLFVDSNSSKSCSTIWTDLKENVFSYVTWMEGDIVKVRMILRDYFYIEVSFYEEVLGG